jgi:uncharacterized protein VirK/YbjX
VGPCTQRFMSNHKTSQAGGWLAKVQRIGVLLVTWPRYTAYRRAFLGTPYAEAAASTGLIHVYLRKFTAPYLSRNFSGPVRLLQLDHHCRFINAHFPKDLFDRLQHGAIVFAEQAGENQQGEFRLDLPVRTHVDGSPCWEGDLILEYWFQTRLLHRMTFSVVSSKPFDGRDDAVLFVGGSQSYGDRELRREASLFNRQINSATATLIAIKAVAEALGIPRIYAVKTINQITLHLRPGDPGSAYEDFWSTNYGEDRGSFFELPLQASPERDSPVAGSHGSRTRRKRLDRQLLKDFVEIEFRALIGRPKPQPTEQSHQEG